MNEVNVLMAFINIILRILAIVERQVEKAASLVIEEYKRNPDANGKCYPDIIKKRGKIFIGWRKMTWRNDGKFEIVSATYDKKAIGANLLTYQNETQKRVIEKAEKKLRRLRESLNMIEQHRKDYKIIINRVRKIYDTTADNDDE